MRVLVLGAGRAGRAIVADLSADERFEVTAADRSGSALGGFLPSVRCLETPLDDQARIAKLAEHHDLVVGALPSHLGLATLQTMAATGSDYVDISFFAEDPFVVDAVARKAGATIVVDCGVAPGLSNLLLGRATRTLERVESFICYVGGLPADRDTAWAAPGSPRRRWRG